MTDQLDRALVSARATSLGSEGVTLYARSLQAEVGIPLSFDIQEPKLTGVEQLLGAVASDVLGGFRRLALRRRLVIDELEAVLKAEVEGTLAYLGVVGESGTPRIAAITVIAYIGTAAPEATLRAVWDEALALAPLVNTLRGTTKLDIQLQISS